MDMNIWKIWMYRVMATVAACGLLSVAGPASVATASERADGPICILAGDEDNFIFEDPYDPEDPKDDDLTTRRETFDNWLQSWVASLSGCGGVPPGEACRCREFDVREAWNCGLGYTFEGLPQIESCQLEVHLKADEEDIPSTDDIKLRYFGNGNFSEEDWWLEFTWQRPFDEYLFPSWNHNSEGTLVLDLSALPKGTGTIDLIPLINADGYLDVLVCDDTAVDYIKLCYVPEEDITIPTISGWGLIVLGLLLLAGAKIYFAQRRATRMPA